MLVGVSVVSVQPCEEHSNGTVDLLISTNATVSLVILVVAIVVSGRPNCTVHSIVVGISIVIDTVASSIVPFVWLR